MSYLLSLVVPTKNRYIYLEKLVDLVISFNTDQIEFVIQDNSDNNQGFINFIKSRINSFPWIKYYYESQYLTSVENFDLAISRCTGEYVCFIGDDDGVVRNITRYVAWMKRNNIEALRSAHSVYYWTGKGRYNQYATFDHSKRIIEWLSPVHELEKVIKNGCISLGRIPVLYTGIVKKTVLDSLYNDIGTYFPGVSPDAANGTVLSFYIKRYIYINTPIVITGTSKETGGRMWKRIVSLKEVPFLRQDDFNNWEGIIPPYWTTTLVWPISIISALRRLNQHNMLLLLDINKVLCNFSYRNRAYKTMAIRYTRSKLNFHTLYFLKILKSLITAVIDKSIRVCSRNHRTLNGEIYFNIKDIREAEELFYRIDKRRCSLINKNLNEMQFDTD